MFLFIYENGKKNLVHGSIFLWCFLTQFMLFFFIKVTKKSRAQLLI